MLKKIYDKLIKIIKENYKSLIIIIIALLLVFIEFPYVVYCPGGTINLNDRVSIENNKDIKGKFQMAYVTMRKGNAASILLSYVIPNWDLESSKSVTYDDESVEEMFKRDKYLLKSSIASATINAYKYASKPYNIKNEKYIVLHVSNDSQTNVIFEDEIISANNKTINSFVDYKNIVTSLNFGDKISLKVKRNNKIINCYAIVKNINDEPNTGLLIMKDFDVETDPTVKYKEKSSESGPSGGLMLSLSIYNNLIADDITKGRNIVGTGTIDEEGNIGEIGGVKYKLLGAINNKADIFLCPKENYEEVKKLIEKNNFNIKAYGVSTFKEAIDILS